MGKNKLLDAPYQEEMIFRMISGLPSYSAISCRQILVVCFLFSAILLSACSLPRIVFLDDPLSPEEHLNLGVAYEKNGEPDNALKEYEKASKTLPMAYLYMGNVYFQKHKYDEAEACYKKSIKQSPDSADAYNNLAWLYFLNNENLDEAERLALRAIDLDPSKKENYSDTLRKIREKKQSP